MEQTLTARSNRRTQNYRIGSDAFFRKRLQDRALLQIR